MRVFIECDVKFISKSVMYVSLTTLRTTYAENLHAFRKLLS